MYKNGVESGRVLPWQVQGPEFKLQYCKIYKNIHMVLKSQGLKISIRRTAVLFGVPYEQILLYLKKKRRESLC
jgi:hypothetical protein